MHSTLLDMYGKLGISTLHFKVLLITCTRMQHTAVLTDNEMSNKYRFTATFSHLCNIYDSTPYTESTQVDIGEQLFVCNAILLHIGFCQFWFCMPLNVMHEKQTVVSCFYIVC